MRPASLYFETRAGFPFGNDRDTSPFEGARTNYFPLGNGTEYSPLGRGVGWGNILFKISPPLIPPKSRR